MPPSDLSHVLSPLDIGPTRIRNRIYMTPHSLSYSESVPDEPWVVLPTERHVYYYAERAKGGVGLITMESMTVYPHSDLSPTNQPHVYDPRIVPRLQRISRAVHEYGTKIFAELFHGGHHSTNPRNMDAGAPWMISYSASDTPAVEGFVIPKELEVEEIQELVEWFGRASANVKKGGFDGIELHATHSFLFNQFLSPFYNKRTDQYGGTVENRMRFMLEVLKGIRDEVRGDIPVGARLISEEMLPGSLNAEDMKDVARRLEASGLVDFLDLDVGSYHLFPMMIAPMYIPPYYEVEYISSVREGLKETPVFGCVGRLNNLVDADRFIAEGKMDVVGGTRAFIADPELVKKTVEGREKDVIRCIACNQFCIGRIVAGYSVHCVVNPASGREEQWGIGTLTKSRRPGKVVVIGGGPGGLEAARVLAMRGHEVSLYEKESELGGQLRLAHTLPGRDAIKATIEWYIKQLRDLNVKVDLGVEADADRVVSLGADAVVLATGSEYIKTGLSGFLPHEIAGWQQEHVVTPEQVIAGTARLGARIMILDDEGFVTAVGLAEMLAEQGKKVEIVTRWPHVGHALAASGQMYVIYPRILSKGVRMTPHSYIRSIEERKVTLFNIFTNDEWTTEVDNVVMVTSKKARNSLYKQLKGRVKELHNLGDSVAPRGIGEAVYEGHRVGRMI